MYGLSMSLFSVQQLKVVFLRCIIILFFNLYQSWTIHGAFCSDLYKIEKGKQNKKKKLSTCKDHAKRV